jgi:hypothetical protein
MQNTFQPHANNIPVRKFIPITISGSNNKTDIKNNFELI